MRKLLKTVLLVLTLTLLLSIPVSASGVTGNAQDAEHTAGTGGGVYTGTGPSYSKTGFLIYVTDADGRIKYEPKLVFYNDVPSLGSDTIDTVRSRLRAYSYTAKYGNVIWDMPPFNDNASSNGERIKDWLISDQGEAPGVVKAIETYWGADAAELFIQSGLEDPEDSWVFCVETVFYHGKYICAEYLGFHH